MNASLKKLHVMQRKMSVSLWETNAVSHWLNVTTEGTSIKVTLFILDSSISSLPCTVPMSLLRKFPLNFKDVGIGCKDLTLSGEDFSKTSKISCQKSIIASPVQCSVTCQPGSETAIPSFLKLRCDNDKWIRQNNVGKYVELASSDAPPRCYSK